jgi:hypothetical protein
MPGGTRYPAIWSCRTAKVRLKLLATGAPVKDFTSSASDGNASLRDGNASVASMAIFPARPVMAQGRRDGGPRYRHHDDTGAAGVPAAAGTRGHLVACLTPQRGQAPAGVSRPITTMFIAIPPASGNLPSGKRGILRRFPGKTAGYSCSNGWHACLGIPDMTVTLGRVRFNAHPPGSIVMTGQWIASWIARQRGRLPGCARG